MKTLAILCLITAAACGNSSADNEVIGQVKKIVKKTPLVCEDYTLVDISLGVMRNGVGSMSRDDVFIAVDNSETEAIGKLKWAAENGAIVRVSYDVHRVSPCWPDHRFIGKVVLEAVPTPAAEAKPSDVRP